jgi:uncharacterized membrane protein
MFKVILQSACVGVGAVVAVAVLGIFVGLPLAGFFLLGNVPPGGAEVGWDLVTMAQNASPTVLLFPLCVFVVGFVFAFRHFSRRSSRT